MSSVVPTDTCNSKSTLASVLDSSLNVYAAEFVPMAVSLENVEASKINKQHIDGELNSESVTANDKTEGQPLIASSHTANDTKVHFFVNNNLGIATADIPLPPEDPRFPPPEIELIPECPAIPFEYNGNINIGRIPIPSHHSYLPVVTESRAEDKEIPDVDSAPNYNSFGIEIIPQREKCENNIAEHAIESENNQELNTQPKSSKNLIDNDIAKFPSENREELSLTAVGYNNNNEPDITALKEKCHVEQLSVMPNNDRKQIKFEEKGHTHEHMPEKLEEFPDNSSLIPLPDISHISDMPESSSLKIIPNEEKEEKYKSRKGKAKKKFGQKGRKLKLIPKKPKKLTDNSPHKDLSLKTTAKETSVSDTVNYEPIKDEHKIDQGKDKNKLEEKSPELELRPENHETLLDDLLQTPHNESSNATAMLKTSSECMPNEKLKEKHNMQERKGKEKQLPPGENIICSQKEHVNIVFIGHVDAGKSTIAGQLMFLMGMIDKRTLVKYKKEAKEISRDSWYLAWALDTCEEERAKGKTVETGRGHFETANKHITILDAPGHKSFVPNMICGTAQADVAVLVISARKNEFETGFENGGQTREHAILAKSAGVDNLLVLVNKMDDPTVNWAEERFETCRNNTIEFLKKVGFKSSDIVYIPVSGQTGYGLKEFLPSTLHLCPWYNGPTFIEYIDSLQPIDRKIDSPLVMPIVDKYRDMGTVVLGKVETGIARKNQSVIIMPNKLIVSIEKVFSDETPVDAAKAGENVKITLKGVEEEVILPGFVLCDSLKPITTAKLFDAQLVIMECKNIITKGYKAMMHMNSIAEEITVIHLICKVNKKTGQKTVANGLCYVKPDEVAIVRIECGDVVCVTNYKDFPQMGRFVVREENRITAIGKVLKLVG